MYVVLESQYQASMSKAAQKINDQQKNVCVEVVGYLLEELRDEGNYAKFQEDVADANIFIGSLIFVQELAKKVEAAVAPRRDQLGAVVVFPSMPEVDGGASAWSEVAAFRAVSFLFKPALAALPSLVTTADPFSLSRLLLSTPPPPPPLRFQSLQVMRLNKVGSFTMANLGQSKSIVADFMKSKKKQDGSSFEEGMLKLLRTL